jgi:hypothetical protein
MEYARNYDTRERASREEEKTEKDVTTANMKTIRGDQGEERPKREQSKWQVLTSQLGAK